MTKNFIKNLDELNQEATTKEAKNLKNRLDKAEAYEAKVMEAVEKLYEPKELDDDYIVLCTFTTLAYNENKETIQKTLNKGDIVKSGDLPLTWFDMALRQKRIVSRTDKQTLSKDDLVKKGYNRNSL